jgi:hypothetical protein
VDRALIPGRFFVVGPAKTGRTLFTRLRVQHPHLESVS